MGGKNMTIEYFARMLNPECVIELNNGVRFHAKEETEYAKREILDFTMSSTECKANVILR
jgi:hypothetical protein